MTPVNSILGLFAHQNSQTDDLLRDFNQTWLDLRSWSRSGKKSIIWRQRVALEKCILKSSSLTCAAGKRKWGRSQQNWGMDFPTQLLNPNLVYVSEWFTSLLVCVAVYSCVWYLCPFHPRFSSCPRRSSNDRGSSSWRGVQGRRHGEAQVRSIRPPGSSVHLAAFWKRGTECGTQAGKHTPCYYLIHFLSSCANLWVVEVHTELIAVYLKGVYKLNGMETGARLVPGMVKSQWPLSLGSFVGCFKHVICDA